MRESAEKIQQCRGTFEKEEILRSVKWAKSCWYHSVFLQSKLRQSAFLRIYHIIVVNNHNAVIGHRGTSCQENKKRRNRYRDFLSMFHH